MGSPWEKYGGADTQQAGPWAKYGASANPVTGPLTPPGLSSVPRPAAPESMSYDRDIFGEVSPFNTRVGQRIKQNVSLPAKMIDAFSPNTQISQPARAALQQVTGGREGTNQMLYGTATPSLYDKIVNPTTAGYRMIGNMAKGYVQDPASLVGDIVTAAPELAELRGRAPRASAAAGEVPRPAVSTGPPAPQRGLYNTTTGELEPVTPPSPVPESNYQRPNLTPEQQAKFTANIDRVNAQLEKQQRTATVARNQQQLAGIIRDDIQNTHEQVRGGLNERSQAVRDATANTAILTEPITKAIDSSRMMLSGVPADLKVFNQIMHFMQQANMEQIGEAARVGLEQGDSGALERWVGMSPEERQAPAANIPFVDAQRQFTALGDAWANADGNVRRALANVKDAYAKSLQSGAESAGIGPQFSQLQKDWSQYFQDWQGRGPLAKMLKSQHANYAVPVLKGPGRDLLVQQYARYGDPQAIREFQRITQEGKQPLPPRVPPPAPPSAPGVAKPGPVLAHSARIAGKIVGGTIGTSLGHPLIGYSAGGEAGSELASRIAARRSIPPTREAYARQVLDDAKHGRISPEEANRRIQRAGGSVRTRPIPRPTE